MRSVNAYALIKARFKLAGGVRTTYDFEEPYGHLQPEEGRQR